ncbi:MAG: elongation factor G [Bacteroidetes bacterium]|jgi:elongation factor G|nr:elongation factor G [Bacteroidota bacterium]
MAHDTKNIRNVVLLGHSGSGKTTFAETMLFESGSTTRRGTVEDGTTASDYTNIEQEKGNSVFSALMHADWRGNKINILDTPGSDDFVGEVVSSMAVADTAIMVINAKSGVEVGTELHWESVEKNNRPALFVINQVDHEKADFEKSLEELTETFGSKVLPVQYPLNVGEGFNTIVDALRMTMYVFPENGGKPEKKDIPDSEKDRAADMHNALVEAAAENDEELMERFFDQGSLSEQDMAYGLRLAIASGASYPVFCCSSTKNMGTGRIMGFINDVCPSPLESPEMNLEGGGTLAPDSDATTSIFIYKTVSEPRVGTVSYFKVCAGTLNSGDELTNPNNRSSERLGSFFSANGKIRENVESLKAGDLGVAVKLKSTHTNNTLTAKGEDTQIEKIQFPNSRIRVAVSPPSKNEMEKLMKALFQIAEEDPTLIVEQSKALKQTLIHGQGQLHLDLVKYRIEKVYGITMDFMRPRISYRETITKMVQDSYRHKKQSGGAGQFGEVHMRIEPWHEGMGAPAELNVRKEEVEELPWGGKLVYLWCIVGGSIDANYSNAIKKGILQKMEEGPLTGSYCQDLRVCIYDGKMHPVDSNDMAFMLASSTVFKNNFVKAGPKLLEPIYDVEIKCGDDVMGDIMGDLQTRRAIISGMDSEGKYRIIKARVPLAEMYQYSSTLRSLSQGRAKFNQELADYSPVPGDLQKQLIDAYKTSQEEG